MLTYTLTPESEIWANPEKSHFLVVDFRENGEVYYRRFERNQILNTLDFSTANKMAETDFADQLGKEHAVRVDVTELDWIPLLEATDADN